MRANSENETVRVEVGDTGPGIAAEDQTDLPVVSATGNEAGKPQGTGLGLALARKFVEMHKGKLWVESEVGKGAGLYLQYQYSPHPRPYINTVAD